VTTSLFDLYKIGIGPSSSHTMGPMRAARRLVSDLQDDGLLRQTERMRVDLFGSLALTGKGHSTDRAILLGLSGEEASIIDPATGQPIGTVATGDDIGHGHEIAASPDGRTAYVPIYGSAGVAKPGTDGRNMMVIDVASRKVVGDVDFGHGVRPHCPIYDPVSKLLYVTTELDKTISIIDPQTLKIVGTIPTGESYSHMLVISHDGRRGYTSNVKPGSVSVLDIPGRKTITVIPISPDSQRISISIDDKLVFTADQTKPQLAVIDTATKKVEKYLLVGQRVWQLALTPDDKYLYTTNGVSNDVSVIEVASLKVIKSIAAGSFPWGVAIARQ